MTDAMRCNGLRSLWTALTAAVLVAWPHPAHACVSSGFATICVDKPTVSGSGYGGGSDGGGSSSGGGGGYQGPSRAERYAEARGEARQAASAWETTADNFLARGDYERAIDVYDKALNTYYTKANERYYARKKAEARQAWLDAKWRLVEAASNARRYDELPDLLKAAQRVWYSKDLQRQIDQIQKAMADKRDADRRAQKAADAAAANAAKNVTPPTAIPASAGGTGSDTKAGDQLLSAAAAHGQTRPNFDDGTAKYAGSLAVAAGSTPAGSSPATVEFTTHIPDAAKNDPVVQQSMAYFAKLDGQKADTQAKIAAVQQQIKSGTGDAAVLKVQEATLNNDLKRVEADQAKTKDQVKERLTSIHLDWNEKPADKPADNDKKDDAKGDQASPGAGHAH